ncbi:MAG: RNHCP domain-containing protein [Candidatus Micrarchaeia archaeon]
MRAARRFSKIVEDFTCENCGTIVRGNGYTDHCPNCLWSKHVDNNPGDRRANCGGMMKPVHTEFKRNGNFIIYYKCERCGAQKHVIAADNDNRELLETLSVRK